MSIINKENLNKVIKLLGCENLRQTKSYSVVIEYKFGENNKQNIIWGYKRKDQQYRFYTIANALTDEQKTRLRGKLCSNDREYAFNTSNIDDVIEVIISGKRYLNAK